MARVELPLIDTCHTCQDNLLWSAVHQGELYMGNFISSTLKKYQLVDSKLHKLYVMYLLLGKIFRYEGTIYGLVSSM